MGYVDNLALLIGNYIRGEDEYARLMRRAMVRWICLSQVLVYRDINIGVRKRFPTLESIVKAGFMLENEKRKLEALKLDYDKYWVPINWAYTLNFEARKKEMCTRDVLTNKINDELKVFRTSLQTLCNYDWVPLPLAYPQMISFAIYSYFTFCLFAQQYLAAGRTEGIIDRIDMYVPWITMLQFIFYVGWTKCAVALMNPMGEDDDDFECNYLLDMNLATALCIADVTRNDYAPVKPDKFWLLGEVEAFYPENTSDSDVGLLHGSAIDARSAKHFTDSIRKRS
ncbi:hypothetical protein AB6A40_009347 [Gnathostoma spinigerum]|uniref:Bestrophin homolog n=1 Tax=Gnathostoma spinigerum TaxID=75299 RepID=A0ABD6ES48_9BILA